MKNYCLRGLIRFLLWVLYIDDFEEIKDGIEKVFEKAYAFTNEISIDDF